MAAPPGAQRMEVRPPVIADNHRLAVDQERLRLEVLRSINDGRETVGPVIAVACEAADPQAVSAHQQSKAVMLDFMNPEWARRR